MVMRKNRMRKNLQQTIRRSMGRYLAIVAIIALGCALFVGLRITKTDMIATGQRYTDDQNMFDLQLLNTYGWSQKEVDAISQMEGVEDAEGSIWLDAYANVGGGDTSVYRFYGIPERINQVYLLSGRMPLRADECLVDGDMFDDEILGQQIYISQSNELETRDSLNVHTYTVVGRVSTPLYMDMNRGSTSLGSGSLTTYVYLHQESFNTDYYTEIYVTMDGRWSIYSDAYTETMDTMARSLQTQIAVLAQQRYEELLVQAEQEYADGMEAYTDGLKEYEEGRQTSSQTLADALRELETAQTEWEEAWAAANDGQTRIDEAQHQLDESRETLNASSAELENKKASAEAQFADAYSQLNENYRQVSVNLTQVNDGITQVDEGIAQIDEGLAQIGQSIPLLEGVIQAMEPVVGQENEKLLEYKAQLETLRQTQAELEATREDLVAQRTELEAAHSTLTEALAAIDQGFEELEASQQAAEAQFADAQAQIDAGYLELEAGQKELDAQKEALGEGMTALLEAETELEIGWNEYEAGKAEAEKELQDAQAQLEDVAQQLADARKRIDDMHSPDVYTLTRNTNAGYLALDSNSDIVSGVAKVLPVFFILIAALVCITTMTRMVEEERTQIGTLKALGYSNGAIMGKYLWYSASAALIGCSLGCALGCTFLPILLWNAYGILFNICPDVLLSVDWGLCLGIAGAYIGISTLVTWYCCRRTLREVPAQLIRPKSPDPGKKILLEYLPFWKKLSFLNKVMLRNVFRYRQRFLMMLIGIGGCTALLLTGFGLRDTVVDIANIQFEEVNHFDLEIYFSEGKTKQEKESFTAQLKESGIADSVAFFYQTSVELEYGNQVRDVYLIGGGPELKEYLTFRSGETELDMPGTGEAFVSIGVAEILDIHTGDSITVRNSDLETMTLTVAGIYENHVYNYIIVTPETITQQWSEMPAMQMAFLQVEETLDIHEASTAVSSMEDVASVTICEDSADMVNSMMDALDLVIVVVVLSAGLLAAIVLYNLTNININERIREIATIKVLGFRAGETSAYVFKENILLTFLGTGFGLLLGRVFLEFVMMNIKIDMVWFKTRLTGMSYFYSVALTLLCAAAVDYVFHHKLDKINMAEALKSVE